jgi:hypothetical protein
VANRRQREAGELEARCIPFLRILGRAANRPSGQAGDPAPFLDDMVTGFSGLLDCLHRACAVADPAAAAAFSGLPVERKLRILRATCGLSCSAYDEVCSIAAARQRTCAPRGSVLKALTLRWSRPLLPGAETETRNRAIYVEWRRSIRYVREGEPLILAGWELRAIAALLCAAGDELLVQAMRKLGGRRASGDALPGAVRLAPSPKRADQGANCSLRTRSSRLFSGSKSQVRPMARSSWTSTRATSRTSL